MSLDFMLKLDNARAVIGAPVKITSAFRCPLHNARVGGAPRSFHKYGMAADIKIGPHDRFKLKAVFEKVGFGGLGLYQSFIHVDTGPMGRRWFGGEVSKRLWQS